MFALFYHALLQLPVVCWQVCLINYKRSGDKFWNQFYLAPVVDENNCVSHYMGIQSDVSKLVTQNGIFEPDGRHWLPSSINQWADTGFD